MLKKNILLKEHSNFKIGGPAKYFSEFHSKEELLNALEEWKDLNDGELGNYIVLGSGTNLVFRDEGFDGLVLKDSLKFIEEKDNVNIGSGSSIEDLTKFCSTESLSGMEWAGGLPGTIGGALRGNAGAFGGETKDHVVEVESLDPNTNEVKTRSKEECNFSYRDSSFKSGEGKGEIILSAKFSFVGGNKEEVKKLTKEKEDYRKERHPLEYPNVGSIFKNIDWNDVPDSLKPRFEQYIKTDPFPVMPTAKIIALSNLKGLRMGDAMVSDKHPNFIVNVGDATSNDVKNLIANIKEIVRREYSISLEEEVYCL